MLPRLHSGDIDKDFVSGNLYLFALGHILSQDMRDCHS